MCSLWWTHYNVKLHTSICLSKILVHHQVHSLELESLSPPEDTFHEVTHTKKENRLVGVKSDEWTRANFCHFLLVEMSLCKVALTRRNYNKFEEVGVRHSTVLFMTLKPNPTRSPVMVYWQIQHGMQPPALVLQATPSETFESSLGATRQKRHNEY